MINLKINNSEKIKISTDRRKKNIMRKYIWYNVMKLKNKKEVIKICPYCNEWMKEREVLKHFWFKHKDIYYKIYKELFGKGN